MPGVVGEEMPVPWLHVNELLFREIYIMVGDAMAFEGLKLAIHNAAHGRVIVVGFVGSQLPSLLTTRHHGQRDGIHYLTLKGMVDTEQSSYSVIEVYADRLVVKGFGRETERDLPLSANP